MEERLSSLKVIAALSDMREMWLRSAPALLSVILAEFVLPSGCPVWYETLMRALGEFEVEAQAARRAVQRAGKRGIIAPSRHGRRIKWTLTDGGRSTLQGASRRLLEFDGYGDKRNERWLIVCVSLPASHGRLRHHLRYRLMAWGLGSPSPGVWITPHVERAEEVVRAIEDLGVSDLTFSYVGGFGPLGDERRVAEQAWDLDDLRARYTKFLETFHAYNPETDAEAFRDHVELVQAWRRFPYVDPALPPRIAPTQWIGVEAARFFRERRSTYMLRSQTYWSLLCSETAAVSKE